MNHLFNFGISQEDERSECAALQLSESSRVLSICSAGDMPLSLLAMGAGRVQAIDVDPAQLHLGRLKLAAVCRLEREAALRFLGYLPAAPREREQALRQIDADLPEDARAFWREQPEAIAAGVIWAGRYERYVARLVHFVRGFLGRTIDGLFACEGLEEQERYFARHFDRWCYRTLFEVAFHPRVFRGRGMDPRSLAQRQARGSLGKQYFARFATMCTAHPAGENYLLQLHLLGRVLSPAAVPAYLTSEGFRRLRERRRCISFEQLDLISALESSPVAAFDCFHLSNLPDWMDEAGFEAVMERLAAKSATSGRAVWRFIHVDRQVPPKLSNHVRVDSELGEVLTREDRFPFYILVPAVLGVCE